MSERRPSIRAVKRLVSQAKDAATLLKENGYKEASNDSAENEKPEQIKIWERKPGHKSRSALTMDKVVLKIASDEIRVPIQNDFVALIQFVETIYWWYSPTTRFGYAL